MINILINAYAVAPNWGSEQGVGWHWIINIAKYCNVYVITEGEWKDEIEEAVKKLPHMNNLHFFYNPVDDKIRKMCWNQGDWRFYHYYAKWQYSTLRIAEEICSRISIDVIHQLNMVGFREPGLLWKIKGPKYVWGPLSGCSLTKLSYFRDAPLKTKLKCTFKNCMNWFQVRYSKKVRSAFNRADVLITPRGDVHELVAKIYKKKSLIISETGVVNQCVPLENVRHLDNDCFNILWVGRFIYTKKLDIALRTMEQLKHLLNIKLHIVGFGLNNEDNYYKELAEKLGVSDMCIWYGRQDNTQVMDLMQQMDVFLFTSIAEVTSTVILEAMQNRLPIVCHNACGFGPIVDESIGRKIEMTDSIQASCDFAKELEYLYNNRSVIAEMRGNFDEKVKILTYEYKGKLMYETYLRLLNRQ